MIRPVSSAILKTESNMFKYYSLIPVQERRFSYGKIPRSGETVAQ